jgi:hypothetical protein
MALKPADLHGRFQQDLVDAGSFAEHFGRAGAGAAPAEDIGLENGLCRGELIVMKDLADEPGDIDMRGARTGARRVEAIQASSGLNPRSVERKRGRHVGEALFQELGRLPVTGKDHRRVLSR